MDWEILKAPSIFQAFAPIHRVYPLGKSAKCQFIRTKNQGYSSKMREKIGKIQTEILSDILREENACIVGP